MMPSRRRGRRAGGPVVAVAVLAIAGCGLQIPSDPDATLDRLTGGVLRAGASADGTLVVVVDGADVGGPLAELVEGFAAQRDADVRWTIASEETLVAELEDGSLDLAIGGVTDSSPWTERVALTRGYDGIDGAHGRSVSILLPMGENALQAALERYLDEEVGP